jgi:hypothetical protein
MFLTNVIPPYTLTKQEFNGLRQELSEAKFFQSYHSMHNKREDWI